MSTPERCRAIRASLGLSARAMSARLGLGNSMWTHYELGQREPGLESCRRLHALGISIDWLISGEGEMWRTGQAPTLAHASSYMPEMQRLLRHFERILDSYQTTRLNLWSTIVEQLERRSTGMTIADLIAQLPFSVTESSLRMELAHLEKEGIISSARGIVRLIRASMEYYGSESKLYMLNAIKDLLHWHMPKNDGTSRRWKLLRSSVFVESGQGVETGRDFMKSVIKAMESLEESAHPSGTDRIDIITSVAIILDTENHNAIK